MADTRARRALAAVWRRARKAIDAALAPSEGWDCEDPLGMLHAPHPVLRPEPEPEPEPVVASVGPAPFTLGDLRASPDCVMLLTPEGRVSFANRTGPVRRAQSGPFSALDWSDLWPEEAGPLLRDALEAALSGRSARFTAHRDGPGDDPLWWDVSVSPVRGDDGAIRSVMAISRDVTALVRPRRAA